MKKNFRKRPVEDDNEEVKDDAEEERRLALEEVKFLQRQRERKAGIPALPAQQNSNSTASKTVEKTDGDGEKDDLVLQDTFAQETAVLVEDPNMVKYVEKELAKKKGKNLDAVNEVENDQNAEDELYRIPEHLKVKERNSNENSTQWTTGIAEIQLPIEYKLKNIEETEAAKKLLQDNRLINRTKTDSRLPSSFSADYFERGKEYAEKLRRDQQPQQQRNNGPQENGAGAKPADAGKDGAGRIEAATDQIMLERFRKRERHRGMRR